MHIFTETSSLCVYMLWKTLQKGQITYQSNVCFYRKKRNVNLEAKHRSWFDGPLKSMNQISNPACTLKCWIIYLRILSKFQNFQSMYKALEELWMKSLEIQPQFFHGHLKMSCGISYYVNTKHWDTCFSLSIPFQRNIHIMLTIFIQSQNNFYFCLGTFCKEDFPDHHSRLLLFSGYAFQYFQMLGFKKTRRILGN